MSIKHAQQLGLLYSVGDILSDLPACTHKIMYLHGWATVLRRSLKKEPKYTTMSPRCTAGTTRAMVEPYLRTGMGAPM